MKIHLDFHQKMKFEKKHFQRWLSYLTSTIDDHYQGVVAERMKTRGTSITMVMQTKMNLYES
jgi:hypothetical protein